MTTKSFKDFNIKAKTKGFSGPKIEITDVINQPILIEDYKIEPSKHKQGQQCLYLQIRFQEKQRVIFIGSKILIEMIEQVPRSEFPFTTTILFKDKRYEFS